MGLYGILEGKKAVVAVGTSDPDGSEDE